jgi:hypothetical protein
MMLMKALCSLYDLYDLYVTGWPELAGAGRSWPELAGAGAMARMKEEMAALRPAPASS